MHKVATEHPFDVVSILKNRIVMVEGVSGSGKTSFARYLKEQCHVLNKNVFSFDEEELLFSYKHVPIHNIEHIRFALYEELFKHFEEVLTDERAIIILDRFHVSAKVVSWNWNDTLENDFNRISQTLKRLSAHICLLTLTEEQFATRHGHVQRGAQWTHYLKQKESHFGVADVNIRVKEEQREFVTYTTQTDLPFSVIPAHSFPLV